MNLVHILALALSLQAASPQLPRPPFVRTWTVMAGENAAVIAVRDGVVLYRGAGCVGAAALVDGKALWRIDTENGVADAALANATIYAALAGREGTEIVAIDAATGKQRVVCSLERTVTRLFAGGDRLLALTQSSELHAIGAAIGKALWARDLSLSGKRSGADVVAVPGLLYVARCDDGMPMDIHAHRYTEMALDQSTGHALWQRQTRHSWLHVGPVMGGDIIVFGDDTRRVNVRTGKTVWACKGTAQEYGLAGQLLVGQEGKDLVGRDARSGKQLWRLPLADSNSSYGSADNGEPTITDGKRVWVARRPFLCVTVTGKQEWAAMEPFTGTAYFAAPRTVVTSDGDRVLCYRPGRLAPLPATADGRRKLAENLAAHFEHLDNAERLQIQGLKPYAFGPLLARYVAWAKEYDRLGRSRGRAGSHLYSLMSASRPLLTALCERSDTAALVAALSELGDRSSWRGELEQILQKKGDPAGYIPALVASLKRLPQKERGGSPALSAVARSSHPEGVAFMLAALRDPKAPYAWRYEAFTHLAGTGGEEGVEAVRAARRKRAPQEAWYGRIDIAQMPSRRQRGTHTDAKGRTWMLFESGVLGNYSDLFIVERIGNKWGRPIFTGIWTEPTWNHPAPAAFRGMPVKKLLEGGWVRALPDDTAIRRDTDGDGLTDLVEKRLGTDRRKADTDGDGLPDAVDPCPNAAPRALGDDEKIMAACLDARFFGEDWDGPAVLSAANVKPFELYGGCAPLMWAKEKDESGLRAVYGGGAEMLHFAPADFERPEAPLIEYGPGRRTARTGICRRSGGLNGDGFLVDLKKIGDEWFVVDMEMAWIS